MKIIKFPMTTATFLLKNFKDNTIGKQQAFIIMSFNVFECSATISALFGSC